MCGCINPAILGHPLWPRWVDERILCVVNRGLGLSPNIFLHLDVTGQKSSQHW